MKPSDWWYAVSAVAGGVLVALLIALVTALVAGEIIFQLGG